MAQKIRKERITKKEFYRLGGFANLRKVSFVGIMALLYQSGPADMKPDNRHQEHFKKPRATNPERCRHNYQFAGNAGLGCVLYKCSKCADEYERDVS